MSSIADKDYLDTSDNLRIIMNTLRRDGYLRLFKFLNDYFKKESGVTAVYVRKKLMIVEHSRAFQLLDSFVVLNLLRKHKTKNCKEILFLKNNEEFWDYAIKKLEEKKK